MKPEEQILALVKEVNPYNPLEYARNIVKGFAREKLDQYILACQDCPIHSSIKTLTYGSVDASVLIVGSYALEEQKKIEANSTYPFVGTKAYDILNKTLKFYGFNPEEFFFINAVNCCPTSVISDKEFMRIPNLEEERNCKIFLDYAIQLLQPIFIIILGNVALNHFVKDSIMNLHGKLIQAKGIPAIATYSPEYLLWCQQHTPDAYEYEKEIFLHDFESIKEYLMQYEKTNLFI